MTATAPVYITCRNCHRQVLEVRWDFHQGILLGEPRIDPVSLDYQQITACIITGIHLWQLHEHARRPVTSHRTRWWPRKPVPGHVLPEHDCARTWDAFPVDLAPEDPTIPAQPPF